MCKLQTVHNDQGQRTIKLSHFVTQTKVLANHHLKLRLMYQRCKPSIYILERLSKLWLKNLHINVPNHKLTD